MTAPEPAQTAETRAVPGWQPKFGEWVENVMASHHNPTRFGRYVRTTYRSRKQVNPGAWYEITDGCGEFWYVDPKCCRPADPHLYDGGQADG